MNSRIKSREIFTQECPTCKYQLSSAASFKDGESIEPQVNDVGLCLKCGEMLMYDKEGKLVVPTLAFIMELPKELSNYITFAQHEIRKFRPVK